jgi:hypothetical protein
MEELLSGLLNNNDPNVEALLGDLIGPAQAHELLTKELTQASGSPPAIPKKVKVKQESTTSISPISTIGSTVGSTFDQALAQSTSGQYRDTRRHSEGWINESTHFNNHSNHPSNDFKSPRQRRKMEDSSDDINPLLNSNFETKSMAYSFGPIGSSGSRVDHDDASFDNGEAEKRGKSTELENDLGQLSLNENSEVRYHGRSSGLCWSSLSSLHKIETDDIWTMNDRLDCSK